MNFKISEPLFRRLAVISCALSIVCVSLLIVLIAIPGGSDSKPTDKQVSPPASFSSIILPATTDGGNEYLNKIVFVGDSTTYHLKCMQEISLNQLWVPSGGTWTLDIDMTEIKIHYAKTGADITIAEAAALDKPEYMIITLGINGVSYLSESEFKAAYKKMINTVKTASPNTKIILQSIFPVTQALSDKGSITNAKIDAANEWVKALAYELDLKYLDTQSILKDSNGALISSYNSYHGDGVHMYTEGYTRVLSYIRTHRITD